MSSSRAIPPRPVDQFRSHAEAAVASRLDWCGFTWFYERVTVNHQGLRYTPDFIAMSTSTPTLAIEVKGTREQALDEVRWEMLTYDSPLWACVDVFVVAVTGRWVAMGPAGSWCVAELGQGPTFETSEEQPGEDEVEL